MLETLPAHYMITGKFVDVADFRQKLETALEAGPKVVQLRCRGMADDDYREVAAVADEICHRHKAPLLLAASVELFLETSANGLHLSSDKLAGFSERPVADDKLLSVSCHSESDLETAVHLGADILLLSPVKPTSSHPDLPGLGWDKFRDMTKQYKQPVYGLGGMKPEDVTDARAAGGQGIAATSGLWV